MYLLLFYFDIVDLVYSDNQCYVEIVEHSGKSIVREYKK